MSEQSTVHRRKLEAENARLKRLLQQALHRADAAFDDNESGNGDAIEEWFAAWRAKAVAALDRPPPAARDSDTPADDPMYEAAPALFTALSDMRDELEAMSGWWTERMADLAQQADHVLEAAGG
jgi:hypothetical protein